MLFAKRLLQVWMQPVCDAQASVKDQLQGRDALLLKYKLAWVSVPYLYVAFYVIPCS